MLRTGPLEGELFQMLAEAGNWIQIVAEKLPAPVLVIKCVRDGAVEGFCCVLPEQVPESHGPLLLDSPKVRERLEASPHILDQGFFRGHRVQDFTGGGRLLLSLRLPGRLTGGTLLPFHLPHLHRIQDPRSTSRTFRILFRLLFALSTGFKGVSVYFSVYVSVLYRRGLRGRVNRRVRGTDSRRVSVNDGDLGETSHRDGSTVLRSITY
jgi:hypothetical protein